MIVRPKEEPRLIAEEYCRKHGENVPSRTIARLLFETYPNLYDSVEHARSAVRKIRGNMGEHNRGSNSDKSLFRANRSPEVVGREYNLMPIKTGLPDYIFPHKKPLILSDIHLPFHNLEAIMVAIDKGAEMGVDSIYLNGDILDCYKISRFIKEGGMPSFQEEREMFFQFIDFLEDSLNVPIVYKAGNHCFDTETEILTYDGFKKHNEISENDKFATLNTVTDEIEFHKAEKIHRLPYKGDMFRVKSRGVDMLVTPDHRLYLKYNAMTKNEYEIVKASEISKTTNRVTFRASGILNNPEYTELTDDEIRICAWLHTDGSVRNKDGGSPKYTLYQRPSKVHLITGILDRLGYKYSFTVRDKKVTSICGKELKKPHEQACVIGLLRGKVGRRKVQNKHRLDDIIKEKNVLMPWVSQLSKRQFDLFLECIIDANGSRRKDGGDCLVLDGMYTFLSQMQHQCILRGYRSSISEYRKGNFRLNITETDSICVDSFKKYNSIEQYDGEVFCVTVPNGTVIVRRGGRVHVSGNCARLEHYIQQNAPAFEDMPDLKLNKLLKLDELKIDYVHESVKCIMGKLIVIHGHEFGKTMFSPVNAARGLFLRAKSSCLMGHCHSTSSHHENNLKGDPMACFSTGALCDLAPRYLPFAQVRWNLGFAVVEIEDSGEFTVDNFRVVNGKAR